MKEKKILFKEKPGRTFGWREILVISWMRNKVHVMKNMLRRHDGSGTYHMYIKITPNMHTVYAVVASSITCTWLQHLNLHQQKHTHHFLCNQIYLRNSLIKSHHLSASFWAWKYSLSHVMKLMILMSWISRKTL